MNEFDGAVREETVEMTPTMCSQPVERRSEVRTRSRGFTLVELLVSIALVVLLLLGVNQVFKLSADAVGTGTVVSTMTRENRAVQSTMQEDVSTAMVANPPFLIINSVIRPDPSQPDNWNAVRRETQFRFFRTGIHHRQTANDGAFASPMQSIESTVWYGLTRYPATGDAAKDFATPQTLFRGATLLLPTIPTGQNHYRVDTSIPYSPLSPDSLADQPTRNAAGGGNNVQELFVSSRLDLANTSINSFQSYIDDRRAFIRSQNKDPDAYDVDPQWWWRMVHTNDPGRYPDGSRHPITNAPIVPSLEVVAQPRKPLDSEGVAKSHPYFVGSVSNFVVEFAGDFVTQNPNNGQVTENVPDGILDFQAVFPNGATVPNIRTRWYGMPRDINGDNIIDVLDDVVPVRDVYFNNGGQPAPFERAIPGDANQFSSGGFNVQDFQYRNYTCIWTGSGLTPKLFRILIKVEDPSGRVPTGQWWEYVLMPQ